MHPRILQCALAGLTFISIQGQSFGQSLYDVVISLSDRQRVVSQQNQVPTFLRNQTNDPEDTDLAIPADTPITWLNVGTAPTQSAVEGLGIGAKIELLNQAVREFDRLKFEFLNSSPGEFASGSVVGALLPYTTRDFDPLPRATPENYSALLRLLAQRVRALRLIQWPSAFGRKSLSDSTNVQEEVAYDDDGNPYVEIIKWPNGPTTPEPANWTPDSIGTGNLDVAISGPASIVSSYFESHLSVSGTYSEYLSDDPEITDPLRWLQMDFSADYPDGAQVSATAQGGTGTQIDGTVYILRRSHWNQIDIEGSPAKYETANAGYVVEGSGNSGSVALFGSPPSATVNGTWVTTGEGDGSLSKKFVEGGYQYKEASVLPSGDPGYSNDYAHSYEKNWKVGCVFYSVFKPTFSRGVDATGMLAKLESAAGILANNSADGALLLHPRPSLLFGIDLGPGLKGTGNGYLSRGSVNSGFYPNYDYALWGTALNPMVRFDSTYALQLAGSCSDYHVVYENDRTSRAQSLPDDGLGWFYTDAYSSVHCNTSTLYRAWDSPRLKQIAGRDLVADVTYNANHYGGYTVSIYRRPTGGATPTPGQALDISEMTLIRTWTFSHAGGDTPHPNNDPEKLEVTTGITGEKYVIQANHILPNQGLGIENEGGFGYDWWWNEAGTHSWTLNVSKGTTEKLRKEIEIDTDFGTGNLTSLREFLDGVQLSSLSSMTLDPFGEDLPADWEIASAGKTIIGSATFDDEDPASGYGKLPTSVTIEYDGIQPDENYAWDANGLLSSVTAGPWSGEGAAAGDTHTLTKKFNDFTYATESTALLDGGSKVKTSSAADGSAGAAVSWSEVEYGTSSNGLPGLPLIVRNSDGSGATYGWNASADGSYILTLEEGLLDGTSVSRGTKLINNVNARGYATQTESFVLNGATVKTGGSVSSAPDDFTDWGMPVKSTDYNTGLASTWGFSNNLSRLSSHTGFLGVVSNFSNYDVLGRAGTVATNGVSAANTYTAHSISSTISGGVTGSVAESRDALGRLTSSNTTWDGVTDSLTVTPDASPIGISRTQSLLGTHQASVRKDDGSVATAYGPTMPFGGNDGTGLDIEDGLVKTTATLLDSSHNPTGTFITAWTNAWGRVRKTSTPSTSGTGVDETLTEYALLDYSTGHQDPQRVRTTDAAGRKFITESDPYNELGMITRSGIDMNGNGSLASPDRYVQSAITASGGKLVTTLYLTENSGLREILRTEWDPSNNYTTVKINSNEETITREPNYSTKTVITSSSKGWSKTETFNALGLTETSNVSGTGIPTADLNPTWRADGSLASVSLTINGQAHSAGFNSNGTLATLTAPGRGNILESHTIGGGEESMTVDGVTNTRRLDGTGHATSGGDVIGKSETLSLNGGGFKNTIHPAIGGNSTAMDTTISYNAAGAPTAKNYPDTSGEIYTHYAGGLLHTVSLARGGSLEFGYSPDDCAKDLTSAVWPAVTSGDPVVFTIPGVAQSYGYDRAGRLETIGDSSGSRGITYQNGRLKQTTWTSGPLSGYKVIRGLDDSGRDTGFELWRGSVLIHSASKTPNGVSGEISDITSGNLKVVIGRNAASQITGLEWGAATARDPNTVITQTWERGTTGRVLAASSNIGGAPAFDYRGTANNEATAFDTKGRRLKCATAGGEWTYAYTNGHLTSANHTTLGSFSYQFDGIGRRLGKDPSTTDRNAANLLNQTVAWTNSQTKTLKVFAHPDAHVWVGINGGADTQIQGFTGSASFPITLPPNTPSGWVPWHTLAVWNGQGEGTQGANPIYNPLASPDAKSEQSGAVWVPPVAETLTYDGAGNRESSALWDYGWNAKNQLVRARTKGYDTAAKGYDITFDYDAEGRRFSKKVSRYQNGSIVEKNLITFIWDGWDIIYERHQLPSGLTTLERKYVWGPDIAGGVAGGAGGLLLIRETKGNATTDIYPLYDGTGHVVALTNAGKELLASYAYGPFGELISATGPMAQANPWRYATKYYDAETGLYCFGLRYYDPVTCQWVSRELLGEDESLNLYEYTHGDPVNNVDELGLAEHGFFYQIFFGLDPITLEPSAAQKAVNRKNEDDRLKFLIMLNEMARGERDSSEFERRLKVIGQNFQKQLDDQEALARGPQIRPAKIEQPMVATAALSIGAATTEFNASINSDWLLPMGAGGLGAKFAFGGLKSIMPILAVGVRTEGRLLTAEMRTGSLMSTMDGNISPRSLLLPQTHTRLIGTNTLGTTTMNGTVYLRPGLSRAEQISTLRHEGVHAFLSVSDNAPFASFRQRFGIEAYKRSAFLNAAEETLAEGIASGSLRKGLNHAFNGAYTVRGGIIVTPWNAGAEAVGGGVMVGGLLWGSSKFGRWLEGGE